MEVGCALCPQGLVCGCFALVAEKQNNLDSSCEPLRDEVECVKLILRDFFDVLEVVMEMANSCQHVSCQRFFEEAILMVCSFAAVLWSVLVVVM